MKKGGRDQPLAREHSSSPPLDDHTQKMADLELLAPEFIDSNYINKILRVYISEIYMFQETEEYVKLAQTKWKDKWNAEFEGIEKTDENIEILELITDNIFNYESITDIIASFYAENSSCFTTILWYWMINICVYFSVRVRGWGIHRN